MGPSAAWFYEGQPRPHRNEFSDDVWCNFFQNTTTTGHSHKKIIKNYLTSPNFCGLNNFSDFQKFWLVLIYDN